MWDVPWCGDPGTSLKDGDRPGPGGPFTPIVVWAYDECDLSAPSREEVRQRAAQNLRLLEQVAVEREFATRLLNDSVDVETARNIVEAVSYLEAEFAKTNTLGLIHAPAHMAASAVPGNLAVRSGTSLKSPMGHTWVFGGGYTGVFGGGYAGVFDDMLIATSPTYGWRDPAVVREAVDFSHNVFVAIAERSVVVGYEKCVATARVGAKTP